MAITHFIKFDGIEGESVDRDHRGEIEVLSWSWGLSNASPPAAGGAGGGAGRATPAEFTFVHRYDKASPALARAAITGRHVREATLSARRSGTGQRDFLKVTMKEVFITSVQQQGQDEQIAEIVTFKARQFATEYRSQSPTGAAGAAVGYQWNVATGTVT